MNLSDITCCVVDHGLFVEIARALGKVYKKVYYYTPWESAFPKMQTGEIGRGIQEIELLDSPFKKLDEIDLFVFPDVNHGAMQDHLASIGKRVWGSRSGEFLELDRVGAKKMMAEKGLPVSDYVVLKGLSAVRDYLKTHRNSWVKVAKYRGNFETFQAENYSLAEPRLDEIEYQLGPFSEVAEFIVEANLPNRFEVAVDAYCIDGRFPRKVMYGVEIKDLGYIGMVSDYDAIPEPITRYDRTMGPYLKEVKYRGFYSAECRIGKDHVPYMIDHCARAGSPPNELYQEMYKNLGEIVWMGAAGKVIEPQMAAKFGAEILIHSQWADKNWQAVDFPEDYRDYIKLRNCAKVGGKWYIIPQSTGMPEIGSVIGMGATMREAIARAREVANSVRGYYVDIPDNSLDKAEEEIEKARSFGLSVMGRK